MTKLLRALLLGATLITAPALAQTATPAATADAATAGLSEAEIATLRADLKADKRQVTKETLKLTDAEAAKFWPVYDRYAADLSKINDSKYGLIKEYTEKFGKYSDAEATSFIKRWLDVDTRAAKLRASYVPAVSKVLPGIKAATFFQIDRRLNMLLNLSLASQLPILQEQTAN